MTKTPELEDERPVVLTIRGVDFLPVDFRRMTFDNHLYLRSVLRTAKLRDAAEYAKLADPIERGDAIAVDLYLSPDASGIPGETYFRYLAGVLVQKGTDWDSRACAKNAALFRLASARDEDSLTLKVFSYAILADLFPSGGDSKTISPPSSQGDPETIPASAPAEPSTMESSSTSSDRSPGSIPRAPRKSRARGRSGTDS